jgi:ABC-2 type transport system ATP-binding protein
VGIDPQSRNHILESIKRLKEMGSTIIYTSHYMEEVEAICTRVAIMDNGRLIAEGTKETLSQYIQEDQVVELSLSNPSFSITQAVKKQSGVKECTISGSDMVVVLDRNANISKLINVVTDEGGVIRKINMEEATLEDVFLSLTGKQLRD